MISPAALRFREACPQATKRLRESDPSLSPMVAEMLVARGHSTPDLVERFFRPTPEALHAPRLLKGMDQALVLLQAALANGERILVHGDYDCDGICATTLLVESLQEIGADVDYHLPDRFKEGYGLSALAVERCIQEGFSLLITVDCGSSSHAEIEQAKQAGIKTIVTDHHAVPSVAPTPDAFINPQQVGCPYPFKGICGTGVAFKLVQALQGRTGAEPKHLLDLVALATVADVVPLVDENRVFVQLGLTELVRSRRVGLTALLEVSGHTGREVVDAFTIGFTLGPRLNAAGRLEHAKLGVELLLSRSLAESRQLATQLDALNEARKECERAIQEDVETRLAANPEALRGGAIVEWGEGWHEGVIGITAGRLAEKYGMPAMIISTDQGRAKGSGRSPENVDLYQVLKHCESLFSKYGGHPRAGGFSLEARLLPELRLAVYEAVAQLKKGPAPVWVDGSLSLAQADLDLVKDLERMEPFGEANPKPTFLLEGMDIVQRRLVGSSGDHLQLEIEQLGLRRRAIAFRQAGEVDSLLSQKFRYDLRCQLSRDHYRGEEQLKIQVSGIVKPPCQDLPSDSRPLVFDFRHLRERRKSLTHYLQAEPESVIVCRDPVQAASTFPDFGSRFFDYQNCTQKGRLLVLLSPPRSLKVFFDLFNTTQPQQVVLLFGAQEIERAAIESFCAPWSRETAVRLWQYLKASRESTFELKSLISNASQALRLSPGQIQSVLRAFQETQTWQQAGSGTWALGPGNGRKIEDTQSFCSQAEDRQDFEEVRAFFSGPAVASRIGELMKECPVRQDSAL